MKNDCSEKEAPEKKSAALKKKLLRKSNCCDEVVTLKKCQNKAILEKSQDMWERKLSFEKKQIKIKVVTMFHWNYFPLRFPQR